MTYDRHYPWVRTDHAATFLGITPAHLRVLANRLGWTSAPLGDGHWHGYHIDDLTAERDYRDARKARAAQMKNGHVT